VTASLLELETEDFASASRSIYSDVGDPLTTAAVRVITRLQDCGAMAGSDPAGRDWAAAYDRAAATTLGATQDVINGCFKLSAMFAQTARNYEAADAASTVRARQAIEATTARLPDNCVLGLATQIPTASGGSGGGPSHWGLIADLVGHVWPNGHQDRLRAAADAWTASADDLWQRSEYVAVAAVPAMGHQLPEFDDMSTVCNAMYMHVREVAGAHRSLAEACNQLAHHLDEVHAAVEEELWSLIEWTAAIEATGALASVLTLGAAEVPTQAVEAARIAKTAARVGELIQRFMSLARSAAQTISAVVERAGAVAARMRAVLNVKLSEASVTAAGRFRAVRLTKDQGALGRITSSGQPLPRFVASKAQLESKFKHAPDFGVAEARGRRGFDAFEKAVSDFVARPTTVRVLGTYRGDRVILSYDRESRLVVVQTPAGEFISGWRMRPAQLRYVVREGSLGGD
jgi:hypothetical protein